MLSKIMRRPVQLASLFVVVVTFSTSTSADEPPATNTQDQQPAASSASESAGEPADSPFDYEASEQISEDLSVSFPVDI